MRVRALCAGLVLSACGPAGPAAAPSPPPPRSGPAEVVAPPRAGSPLVTVTADPDCELVPRRVRAAPRLETAIAFGVADGRPLRLDLAVPPWPGPHPLAVVIHGGSFRRGHRRQGRTILQVLASRGVAAASIDYRLLRGGQGRFPAPVADARCALGWLRAHAAERDLDPTRFAVMGFSAGAHIAAVVALAAQDPALDDAACSPAQAPPPLAGAILFYGAYDLRPGRVVGPGADGTVTALLGVAAGDAPALAALASPITHVSPDDPPILLVHGARDSVVDVEQARALSRALADGGVPHVFVEVPGGVHGFGLFPPDRHQPGATCATLRYLDAVLSPAPAPPEASRASAAMRTSAQ